MSVEKLEISLMGGFSVRLGERAITAFRSAKSRGLLAYLASQPDQDHPRTMLATLFWGDLPDSSAKTNLRIELSNLRKLLSEHPALDVSLNAVRFHSEFATVDVVEFHQVANNFFTLPAETQADNLHTLTAATEAYQGELLAGLQLYDAIEFDDWRLSNQEQLHDQVMLALTTLQARYAEQGRWPEVAIAARRQLALVPWTETAHRNLMQALAAQGQTQAALEQFEKCRKILDEEIGVEPSLPTLELAERLRDGRPAAPAVQHNLPRQLKPLVGRQEEVAQLRNLLLRESLVTIWGIGGVGKSHLAQTVGQSAIHNFIDGVWFIPLANLEESESAADRIALAIGAAIGFTFADSQNPLAELTQYVAERQMLLILDNCEHLLAGVESVLDALMSDSTLHVLATSRARLRIEGEVAFPIEGLAAEEAFTLFVERARHVVPSFASVDREKIAADVHNVCEQVAGLPLGIELASSWVEHFSVAEIGQQLSEMAIEPRVADGVVGRHHSLSAVFAFSWKLLSLREQGVLARLSVFRGGFDRDASTRVADGGLSELSTLIAHSLVQRLTAGRYDLHPLIREFASGKLNGDEEGTLVHKYSDYYLEMMIRTESKQRAERLRIDFENVRNGWQLAVSAGDAALVQRAAPTFGEIVAQFGLLADGNSLYEQGINRFAGDAQFNELVAQLLDVQYSFHRAMNEVSSSITLLQRILPLTSDIELLTRTHVDLANEFSENGEWEQADYHFDQVEALTQKTSDLSTYIQAVEGREHVNTLHFRGDYALSIKRLEGLLVLLDTATTPISNAETLRKRVLESLPIVGIRYGDYALSIRYGLQNLAHVNALSHQQDRVWSLLDLALSEQFAGMFTVAIAHNQEALLLAEEIGATDAIGLLQANLCLTMRQSGDLEQGLIYGRNGINILNSLGLRRQVGQARNRVGHTLMALGRYDDAYAAYGDALDLWNSFKHPNRYEAVAGQALAAFQLGKEGEALALLEEALAFVDSTGLAGIVEPVLLFLNCESVLRGTGQVERATKLLGQAAAWVETIAGRISEESVRQVFLNERPDNQRLRERMASVLPI